MDRMLEPGDTGPAVALLQRDLNRFYEHWGAPPRLLLTADGRFGALTALAVRRVKLRLGLERGSGPEGSVTVRDRLVIRHGGRAVLAHDRGEAYEIPAVAARTPEERRRGKDKRDYEKKLRAR